jgi:hypothetical protein
LGISEDEARADFERALYKLRRETVKQFQRLRRESLRRELRKAA